VQIPIPAELQALLRQHLADAGVSDPDGYHFVWDSEDPLVDGRVQVHSFGGWRAADYAALIGPFEATRRELAANRPTWAYVSGGRALHAIYPDSAVPVCGVDPLRGSPPHRPPWIAESRPSYSHRRLRHGECVRLAARRELAEQNARWAAAGTRQGATA
jgi:hypothetical protein